MEAETEFVSFDRHRVVKVLEQIVADLDELARCGLGTSCDDSPGDDSRIRHRRQLAEPPTQPKKLSQREQRAALRAELGLPPE